MSVPPEHDVCVLVRRLARPSVVLDKRDAERMSRAAEAGRVFLQERSRRWLAEREDDTILMTYSSDVTPLLTRERFRHAFEDISVVRCRGSSNEFLIQRSFMCDLKGSVVCLMEKPVAMAKKTAWAHFCAYRAFVKTPREQGHRGLHVLAHVYDRAIQAPLERLHRQWQVLYDSRREEELHEGTARREWLHSWFVSVGCAAHDCHGGLKWAVLNQWSDKSLMRAGYIVVESVANGFDLLLKHVVPWLCSTLEFQDWSNDFSLELYMALDVDPGLLDTLVDLQLRSTNGRLMVAEKHRHKEGLHDLLVTVLLKSWSFKRWSESRWLSLGSCCRSVVLSLFFGLDSLVSYILSQGESKYHLGGFRENLTDQVRDFMVTVAIASRAPDSVLAMLVEDDRVPTILDAIDEEIDLELQWTTSLPEPVWAELGAVAGRPPAALRSACCSAAMTAAGYVLGKLRVARKGVWRLLRGDRRAHLAELAAGPVPENDEVLYKIFELLRLGFPVERVLEGLDALAKVSWTTLVVEQGHASASCLMKAHSQYGMATLKARSMLLQIRPLLADSMEEIRLRAALRKLDSLGRKQMNRFKGRQLYMRELHFACDKKRSEGGQLPPNINQDIFKKHSKSWSSQSQQFKAEYERRAADAREEAGEKLREQRRELSALVHQLQVSASDTSEGRVLGPLRVADAKLSDPERRELQQIFMSEAFSQKHVEGWREKDETLFMPPGDEVCRALESGHVPFQAEKPPMLPWVSLMCWNRTFFVGCVIKIQEPSGADTFWKFVYGVQNPLLVCMVHLLPQETTEPMVDAHNYDEVWLQTYDFVFEVDWSLFRWSDEGYWQSQWPVSVLPGAMHAGKLVRVDGEWLSIDKVAEWFPPVPKAGGGTREFKTSASVDGNDILAEHPWLRDFLSQGRPHEAASRAGSSHQAANHGVEYAGQKAAEPYQEELDSEAVMEALTSKRLTLGLADGPGQGHFAVVLRGGPGLFARTGKSYDEIRGQCSSDSAAKWCDVARLNKSFAATIAKYGEETSQTLAREWVRKMSWLHERAQSEGPSFVFSDLVLREFQEAPEIQRLFDAGDRAVRARIVVLRGLKPRQ